MVKWMKFIRWDMDKALFRPATNWEIFRAWWHDQFHKHPDPNNLLLDFQQAEEILTEYHKEDNMGTIQKCNKCKKTSRWSSGEIRNINVTTHEVTCECGNKIVFGG